ncbi:GNAT family acetyltransferase [Achromobacter sp. Root83]|uniref:GNAT family N-acetyltransferase n=1 Tax=Achromobacter sp. Root83 TaxID=1736602 RepID=UPI00070C3CA8|nr:GNAT family N-acetyltransferase [Achromobacter sp. Root83]KRC85664.1 GNAT family acetyltransferase [Achromobacter sp. Root83]
MPTAEFPDDFLTQRLHARRMSQAHLPFITEMHANTDLMESMGGTRDAAASRRYVAQNITHWTEHGYGMYVLDDRDTGRLAGRAGLKVSTSPGRAGIELAYALHPDCWGKGYAPEIARVLIALGFRLLPVDVLGAVALRSNTASRRVMEKTGLRYVGMTGDKPEPKVCYEIRRTDWRKLEGV